MQLQVPVQVEDMSDQILNQSAVSRSTEIVPHGVYCHNRNIEGQGAITPRLCSARMLQVHSRYWDAGESSYPCMDRGGSGNQCCNPGLGSGLLGLSISVLGSR